MKTDKLSNGRLFGTLKGGCGISTYCLAGKVIFGELVICEINYQIRSVCSLHYKCVSSSSLNPINSRFFLIQKTPNLMPSNVSNFVVHSPAYTHCTCKNTPHTHTDPFP